MTMAMKTIEDIKKIHNAYLSGQISAAEVEKNRGDLMTDEAREYFNKIFFWAGEKTAFCSCVLPVCKSRDTGNQQWICENCHKPIDKTK